MYKAGLFLLLITAIACKSKISENLVENELKEEMAGSNDFTIVFASCNDQNREQPLWLPILENKPDLFIWGGDNIYADTANMSKMGADYQKVLANPDYKKLVESVTIIGTWDDHDYGLNDGGVEWKKKEDAQELFLDFLDFPDDDPLRVQQGIYYSRKYNTDKGSIKVILLDTRYFRDSLRKSDRKDWRYEPWGDDQGGTILGEAQWKWLETELQDESAQFNIIVSSIQFLADEHGWEKWGNYPSEVEKMYQTLKMAKSSNILLLSGDRHLAEFSVDADSGLPYDLVDFTSSGLTHTYPESPDTPNRYRKGKLIKDLNFGVLNFDFDNQKIRFEVKGLQNKLLEVLEVHY